MLSISLRLFLWLIWIPEPLIEFQSPVFNAVFSFSFELLEIPWLNFIINTLIIIIQAFIFHQIIISNEILYKNTYFPAFFYVVIQSFLPFQLYIHPSIIANFFLLGVFSQLCTLYYKDTFVNLRVLNAGLFTGLAIILSPETWYYLPGLFIGMSLFRTFKFRDYAIAIIGLAMPFYFAAGIFLIFDKIDLFYNLKNDFFAQFTNQFLIISDLLKIYLGFLIFILFISSGELRQNFFRNTIRTRKLQQLLLVFMIIGLILVFASPSNQALNFSSLALSMPIFLSYYFLKTKRLWLRTIFFIIVLLGLPLAGILNDFVKF